MTSKIFRSTVFVAVVVLLCSLGIVIGVLYNHFTGVQVQQLKDELVNSDFAAKLMEEMQMPADQVEMIKALKIEDLKAQEFATMTVQQLFDGMMADSETAMTWASLVETLVAMKTVTMAQMDMVMPELPIESVEKIAFTGGLQFNDKGTALTAFNFGAGVSLNIPIMDWETDTVQIGVGNVAINFALTVAEFSTTAAVITPPAADQIAAQ